MDILQSYLSSQLPSPGYYLSHMLIKDSVVVVYVQYLFLLTPQIIVFIAYRSEKV